MGRVFLLGLTNKRFNYIRVVKMIENLCVKWKIYFNLFVGKRDKIS